ncbi:hypothetical protein Hanom_Chr05g00391191 [Helianthus anomalus]
MPLFRWPLVLLLPCRSQQTTQGNPKLIVSQHIWCGSGSCSVAAGRLFKGLHVPFLSES